MRNSLAATALMALTSACGVPKSESSTVQFFDLTTLIADETAKFDKWSAQDQARQQFPVGLCLESISAQAKRSDTLRRDGSVGIPLTAPGAPVGAVVSLFGGKTESNDTTLSAPFGYAYPLPRVVAETPAERREAERAREASIQAWRDTLPGVDAASVQSWAGPPPGIDQSQFDDDASLAAELWRIRTAMHYPVYRSAAAGATLLRPFGLSYERDFVVQDMGGGRLTLSLLSGASLGAGVERTSMTSGKFTITFAVNQSLDPFACDRTSLGSKDK